MLSMLWSINRCQKRASADKYHMTVSRAQVSSYRGYMIFEVICPQVTSFVLITGSTPTGFLCSGYINYVPY